MEPKRAAEIWASLIAGAPLDRMGLPLIGGRLDLRGIAAPQPTAVSQYIMPSAIVKKLDGVVKIEGVRWRGLDFSGADLRELRIRDTSIEDCVFDKANCSDWRLWGTSISDSTLRAADLRRASLGAVDSRGKRNSYARVDFGKADLRGSSWTSAEMTKCSFDFAKLQKVDFEGTNFVECSFAGELEEVVFSRHGFQHEKLPPNEMRDVDFSKARFTYVEFRGLDMDHVRWPESDDQFVIDDYPATLDRLLAIWQARQDMASRQLAAAFGVVRKWVSPRQRVGVVSEADLLEAGGEEAVAEFLELTEAQRISPK